MVTRRAPVRTPAFHVGQLFTGTIRCWIAGLLPTTVLSVLFYLPLFAIAYLLFREAALQFETLDDLLALQSKLRIWAGARVGGAVLLGAAAVAAITHGVVERLRGRSAGVAGGLAATGRRLGTVLLTAVVLALMTLVIFIVVAFIAGMLLVSRARVGEPPSAFALALTALAFGGVFILLISRYLVAIPVALFERVGPVQAIGVSSRLTAGSRGAIAVAAIVFLALGWVLNTYVVAPRVDTVFLGATSDVAITALLTTPLVASAAAFAYQRLKLHKDGINVLDAAKVFD